jgi:hypothetical protein
VPNPRVLQVDGIHQVVQRHMGVSPTQSRKQGSKQPHESVQRIAAKRAEEQIEPHHIGFQFAHCTQKSNGVCGIFKRPATQHREAVKFRLCRGNLISENRQADKRIAAQLFGDVQSILAQSSLAGWKGRDQTNLHLFFGLVGA